MSEIFDHRQKEKTEQGISVETQKQRQDLFSLEETSQKMTMVRDKKSSATSRKGNALSISKAATMLQQEAFSMISDVAARRQVLCDKDELCDFAAFMGEEPLEAMDLITLYMGEDEELYGMDKMAALDKMRNQVLNIFPESVEPCSDAELTENARELESLTWKVTAFDRLSEKYGYMAGLSASKKKQISDKLTRLRSTANYYLIRKDIITDPFYISHEGDDLSMDFGKEGLSSEESALSMRLLEAYMAEKNMLKKNKATGAADDNPGMSFMEKEPCASQVKTLQYLYTHDKEKQLIENNFDRAGMMKLAEETINTSIKRRELQV